MNSVVVMPVWLVAMLAFAAIVSVYHHLFAPLLRMYLRNRERNLNQKLSSELSRQLPEVLNISRSTRIDLFNNKPEVKAAIDQAVHENQGTREILEHKVKEFARELTPGFYALFYFRIGRALARSYIRMMYDVNVPRQPPASISAIPESASVVLVGNHRSNIDVMLLAHLSSRTNMISFAAGEWAKAWPMSALIRMSGSYMIRRAETLPLYRKILAIHLRDLVKVKMPQGIFLEGGLTRDGTIQSVKLGLLSYLLSALGEENVADIVFIPVAFNYDQVPEDRTLLKHQDRGFRNRSKLYTVGSTLFSLLNMAWKKYRRGKAAYGRAEVSFGEPLSMQAWLAQQGKSAEHLTVRDKYDIVGPVSSDLIGSIKALVPVLPVSVVSSVFALARGSWLTELQVQNRAAGLLAEFRANGAVVSFSDGEAMAAFREGLDMLVRRHVLYHDKDGYTINENNRALLQYLYNSTKHLLDSGNNLRVAKS